MEEDWRSVLEPPMEPLLEPPLDALSEMLEVDALPLFEDTIEVPRMETFEAVDWMLDPIVADWVLFRRENLGQVNLYFQSAVVMHEYGAGSLRDTLMSPVESRNRVVRGQLLCRISNGGSTSIVSGRVTIDCRGRLPTVYKSCELDADTIQVELIKADANGNLFGTVYTIPKENTFTITEKSSWTATKYCDTCAVQDRACNCDSNNVGMFRNDMTLSRIQGGLPAICDGESAWSPGLATTAFGLFNGSFLCSPTNMLYGDVCRNSGGLAARTFKFRNCGTHVSDLRWNLLQTFLALRMEYPPAGTQGCEDGSSFLLGYPGARENSSGEDQPQIGCGRPDTMCPYCSAVFKRKYEMTRHVRTVHFNERKHQCDICGKKFIHEGHLRVHRNSVHNGESEAACQACGKMFATKAKANRHFMAVHEKQKKHQCDACGKSFFQRSDLKKHYKTHTQATLPVSVRELSISN